MIKVSIETVKAAGCVAANVKKPFKQNAVDLTACIFSLSAKTDKKLVAEMNNTLDCFLTHCMTLGDVLEKIQEYLMHKNAAVKRNTMLFANRALLKMQIELLQKQKGKILKVIFPTGFEKEKDI